MLQVVVEHGSGYTLRDIGNNKNYEIAGKTGTAQIPSPDGNGYIVGANIGSFVGYAPANNPKFVLNGAYRRACHQRFCRGHDGTGLRPNMQRVV